MLYKISVPQIDEKGSTKPQYLILHNDTDPLTGQLTGSFITKDAYVKFINSYFASLPQPTAADQIVAVRFNRHILEMLLSLPDCESLVFANAKKDVGGVMKDTITIVAVDIKGTPLGWDPATGFFDPEKFAAIEWGLALTKADAVGRIVGQVPSTTDVNFEEFFGAL
jgi:hypothetical protein